jgi:nitrite reductase/ring-hydroxylating ferredoxin subunit
MFGSLEELKAKGRLVIRGGHRPILVIYDRGRVFALDNRCLHMGFPCRCSRGVRRTRIPALPE